MKIAGLRHSAERVGGIVFFGRMLDKIQLHAVGNLPKDYNQGTGFDARICTFLRVKYPDVVKLTLAGGNDEAILTWCFENGRKPSDEEIFIFNSFLTKRGWKDDSTPELERMKSDRGFAHRADIETFFDFHKADEES